MQKVSRQETVIDGKKVVLEVGKYAAQANGAATCQIGETVVLATAVMGKEDPNIDYFPLMVEYEERMYAAGKIKSSRFVKREGRATDEAILTARLVDRGLRPLFAESFKRQVQIIVTVLSYDGENDPDLAAILAASTALMVSDIPFTQPIAGIRVSSVDGKYTLFPSKDEQVKSVMDLVVSAKADGLVMVEAGANMVTEELILGGIEKAQVAAAELCGLQEAVRKEAGKEKVEVAVPTHNEDLYATMKKLLEPKFEEIFMTKGKVARNLAFSALKASMKEELGSTRFASLSPEDLSNEEKQFSGYMEELFNEFVRTQILENARRFEGRALDQIRDINVQVGVLPRTHGTGLFQRGETQVMTIATLGAPGSEQILDGMEIDMKKYYMHHYNFPGFSVGEVERMGWPSRREIGHGALAERALVPVLPDRAKFPYIVRLVSEVLEANGSTSMASTCGSTLALMDAGVPIKAPVAGVAMGLIMDKSGKYQILTDIQGEEDHLGDMDFKVTGTKDGVTAMQMDIKVEGITREIMIDALEKAKVARQFILDKMTAVIPAPRAELSKFAPRIVTLMINPAKIKDVIGKGGETINKIIDETGVEINIEDDGQVNIASADGAALEKAVKWVNDLTRELQPGEIFDGEVTRVENFGAFVRVLPGKEGLVHVSQIANKRIEDLTKVVKVGDKMKVMVMEIDEKGRLNLSRTLAIAKIAEQKSEEKK
jgi:polyribonucleotide nucleotidyltransferase